jgi:hypothetical protein
MSNVVIVHTNSDLSQFFLSTSHCQKYKNPDTYPQGLEWVPVTHHLPHYLAPRPSCPEGCVRTVKDVINVYYYDLTEIPNPSPEYQPL